MAEGLLRQKAVSLDLPWEVKSAGIAAWPGDTATPEAVEIMRSMNIDLSFHRSSSVSQWLMDWATDIFAMTEDHYRILIQAFPEKSPDIHLFTEPEAQSARMRARDIPDPFGRGVEAYRQVAFEMEAAISCLFDFLKEK